MAAVKELEEQIAALEEENAALENKVNELEVEVDDLKEDVRIAEEAATEAENRLDDLGNDGADDDLIAGLPRLTEVISHLTRATGVFTLHDLQQAARDAGLDI